METFYKQAGVSPNDEKVFVSLSKDLGSFPPTYVTYCGKDPLRDDGKVLVEMLKERGVKTKRDFWDGMPHYWWMFPGIRNAGLFYGGLIGGCKWAVAGGK